MVQIMFGVPSAEWIKLPLDTPSHPLPSQTSYGGIEEHGFTHVVVTDVNKSVETDHTNTEQRTETACQAQTRDEFTQYRTFCEVHLT